MLVVTVLKHFGYTIKDLGGTGEFTPQELRNHFYWQETDKDSSIRWRPVYLQEEIERLDVKDKLYHPIKG